MIAYLSNDGKNMLYKLLGCFEERLWGDLEQNAFCKGCKETTVCQPFLDYLEENGGLTLE